MTESRLISDVKDLIRELEQLRRDSEFYNRVLMQAVLSHGGKLDIDPSKDVEAKAAINKGECLEFGNGRVTILGSKYSLWPTTEPKGDPNGNP